MKAVTYCIRTFNSDSKMSGRGYIDDRDLLIACLSKSGKPYVKRFADVVKKSYPVIKDGVEDGFRVCHTEHYTREVTFPKEDKRPNYTQECETTYSIWYKVCEG